MMRAGSPTSTVGRLICFAFICLISACGGLERAPDIVVMASGADLESPNPLVTIHPLSKQVQRYVLFVTLARFDDNLVPEPYAAKSWSFSGDRRLLTFTLHQDIPWHDGEITTARDVAWTINAARDPKSQFPRASDLAQVVSASAPDDSTVQVVFSTPQPFFPLIFCELPILPEHLLGDIPLDAMRDAPFSSNPVGNGPFRFVSRERKRRWVFERNENFPASLGGPAGIRRYVIAIVDEATTKFAGLVSGELDVAGISPGTAQLTSEDPRLRVLSYPLMLANGIVFNTHRAPFNDVRVRRAVSLAVDRDRLVQVALAGYGLPSDNPVVPENPFSTFESVRVNRDSSSALLDAAGWKLDGTGVRTRDGTPLEFELLTVGSANNELEQLLQADLALVGIKMTIRSMEFGAFLARARETPKNFDAIVTGIPGDLSLAYLSSMFESSLSGSAIDYADFHDVRLDSLFAATRVATDRESQREAWAAVQERLNELLPVAWLYHSRGVQGLSGRLTGVVMDLRGELVSILGWGTEGRDVPGS